MEEGTGGNPKTFKVGGQNKENKDAECHCFYGRCLKKTETHKDEKEGKQNQGNASGGTNRRPN